MVSVQRLKELFLVEVVSIQRSKSMAKELLGPNQVVFIERWSLDTCNYKKGFTVQYILIVPSLAYSCFR